jgi:hypothetical protein
MKNCYVIHYKNTYTPDEEFDKADNQNRTSLYYTMILLQNMNKLNEMMKKEPKRAEGIRPQIKQAGDEQERKRIEGKEKLEQRKKEEK